MSYRYYVQIFVAIGFLTTGLISWQVLQDTTYLHTDYELYTQEQRSLDGYAIPTAIALIFPAATVMMRNTKRCIITGAATIPSLILLASAAITSLVAPVIALCIGVACVALVLTSICFIQQRHDRW